VAEYAYCPVDSKQVPYGDFAVRFARSYAGRVLHSYGALQCLERLLALIREDGFLLVNDYGQTQVTPADQYEHQHFSQATGMGVNFPLLRAYFADPQKCRWVEPEEESASIHARLLGPKPAPQAVACFHKQFGKAASAWVQEPAQRAREQIKAGRFEAAASSYRLALERQPSNWVLMGEVAQFLTFSLRQAKAGIDLAKVALGQNPTSAELWNTLGDSLFEFGRVAEARQAYLRAQRLGGSDVRSRFNLAWVYAREKDYPAALNKIAEALALDRTGEYRERLLQKQTEVLARLACRHQQEHLRLANRISNGDVPPPADHRNGTSAAPREVLGTRGE
jgi:tetratricopeptide (TPR) repeat protein